MGHGVVPGLRGSRSRKGKDNDRGERVECDLQEKEEEAAVVVDIASISTRGHIRSLSAPEKASKAASSSSWDFSPRAALNQALKESIQNWRWRMKFKGTEDKKKRILNDRRAALENDVAQLQTKLEDEKAVRQGLERALGGSDQGTLSNLAPQTQKLITEITSLEKEVTHLEQHVLNLYRRVLDQRLVRHNNNKPEPSSSSRHKPERCGESRFKLEFKASEITTSSSSQLHHRRHAAPSPPSPKTTTSSSSQLHHRRPVAPSPEITTSSSSQLHHRRHVSASSSPAPEVMTSSSSQLHHRRHVAASSSSSSSSTEITTSSSHRRHVSAPSSSSSSSSGASSQGYKRPHSAISGDTSKTRHGSLLGGSFYSIDEEPAREVQDFSAELPSVSVKASPPRQSLNALNPGKTCTNSFQAVSTPKQFSSETSESSSDPNKLSEELVRCMAAIYCKLADPPLPQLAPTFSPSSSTNSSSTTISSPNEGSWSPRWRVESCELNADQVPSNDLQDGAHTSGPYGSMVEVPWICVDKDRLTYAARALRNFRTMVERLEQVDPGKMSHEQKLAFWINIYNALMMHAYLAYGIPRNRLKRLSLLQKAAYKVGVHSISAQTIEHSILSCRSIRPSQWFQSLLSQAGTKFKSSDERRAYGLHTPEPLVCFALGCGGRSDPAIRVYSAKNVRSELELAKLEFLQASVRIRGESKVLLPRILEWYARELSMSPSVLLETVCQSMCSQLQACIRRCILTKPHKTSAHCVEWIPYSFGFRYIFVPDLAHRFPPSAQ